MSSTAAIAREIASNAAVPALQRNNRDYKDPAGSNLLGRTQDFLSLRKACTQTGCWLYSRFLKDAPYANASANVLRVLKQRSKANSYECTYATRQFPLLSLSQLSK